MVYKSFAMWFSLSRNAFLQECNWFHSLDFQYKNTSDRKKNNKKFYKPGTDQWAKIWEYFIHSIWSGFITKAYIEIAKHQITRIQGIFSLCVNPLLKDEL